MTTPPSPSPGTPLLRVVRGGEPTADEVAALVAAVTSLSATAAGSAERRSGSRWNDRRAQLRGRLHPGPGAWVASARR